MASLVSLGPEGDNWVYDRRNRVYDLTRNTNASSGPRYAFATTKGRGAPSSVVVAPSKTALVVVDMQNFFLHPRCNDHPAGLAAAERIRDVIERCRVLGLKIIWLNWGLTEQDLLTMPAAVQRSFSRSLLDLPTGTSTGIGQEPLEQEQGTQARYGFGSDMGFGRGRLLMEGSWNAEVHETVHPCVSKEEDTFCSKNRISGLWADDTPLAQALKSNSDLRTLLFTGVNTDQCVLGTLFDAYNRGYDCVMIEDCCATKTPGGDEVTAWNVSRGYGFVTDSISFCQGDATALDN